MQAGRIVAAVLLPPLGVYLARGPAREFLIGCGLTVLGFLPGMAFALWTVIRDGRAPDQRHAGEGRDIGPDHAPA